MDNQNNTQTQPPANLASTPNASNSSNLNGFSSGGDDKAKANASLLLRAMMSSKMNLNNLNSANEHKYMEFHSNPTPFKPSDYFGGTSPKPEPAKPQPEPETSKPSRNPLDYVNNLSSKQEIDEKIRQARDEYNREMSRLEDVKKEYIKYKDEYERISRDNWDLRLHNEKLQKDAENYWNLYKDEINQYKKQMTALKSKLDNFNSGSTGSDQDIFDEEIKKLKNELAEANKNILQHELSKNTWLVRAFRPGWTAEWNGHRSRLEANYNNIANKLNELEMKKIENKINKNVNKNKYTNEAEALKNAGMNNPYFMFRSALGAGAGSINLKSSSDKAKAEENNEDEKAFALFMMLLSKVLAPKKGK